MDKRIQIDAVEPKAYEAIFSLENYLQNGLLNKSHYELIKIRASQLNGCAFCIDMHTKVALKMGEDAQRIFLLNAWRDSNLFAEEEQLILQLTEEVTLIHKNGLSDETYRKVVEVFGENYFAQLIMAIVTINSWNRIAISTHKPLMD